MSAGCIELGLTDIADLVLLINLLWLTGLAWSNLNTCLES